MKYRHFRYDWEFHEDGAATVAIDPERGLAAISVCSHKDQFCKKTGREAAAARIPRRGSIIGAAYIFVPDLARKNPAYTHFHQALVWLVEQMCMKYERITIVKGDQASDTS